AAYYDKDVRLWDALTRQAIGEPISIAASGVYSIALSPDGKTLAAGGGDHSLQLLDLASRQIVWKPTYGGWPPLSLAFSPDGSVLASGAGSQILEVVTAQSGKIEGTADRIVAAISSSGRSVTGVAFSPDGKILAVSSDDSLLYLFDAQTHAPVGKPLSG